MSYQVFARKYRPQTFAEVVGQEHITRTLENAIRLGRIAQTYLFVGPRGTGKTSTARILAKALNCTGGPRIDFDPIHDDVCVEIAEGRSMDVLEIDGASNNGVEQVRDLRENVRYAPTRGKYKVYIIDEVHMLTGAAFNALLKTLEEPPPHVKFIFATTEVHKLPATILSRCQRFDLRRIPDALISTHLEKICGKEGVSAEPAALQAIARYAEGGLRDAESALDQMIGFYGNRVTESEVLSQFGLSGFGPVASLARCIVCGDIVHALEETRDLTHAGKDLGRLSQDLLRFFRNLLVFQIAPAALAEEVPAAELQVLQELSPSISRATIAALLEELGPLESRLRYALSKEVLFDVALIQLCQLREKISLESILLKLSAPDELAASTSPATRYTPPVTLPKRKLEDKSSPEAHPSPTLANPLVPSAARDLSATLELATPAQGPAIPSPAVVPKPSITAKVAIVEVEQAGERLQQSLSAIEKPTLQADRVPAQGSSSNRVEAKDDVVISTERVAEHSKEAEK